MTKNISMTHLAVVSVGLEVSPSLVEEAVVCGGRVSTGGIVVVSAGGGIVAAVVIGPAEELELPSVVPWPIVVASGVITPTGLLVVPSEGWGLLVPGPIVVVPGFKGAIVVVFLGMSVPIVLLPLVVLKVDVPSG